MESFCCLLSLAVYISITNLAENFEKRLERKMNVVVSIKDDYYEFANGYLKKA